MAGGGFAPLPAAGSVVPGPIRLPGPPPPLDRRSAREETVMAELYTSTRLAQYLLKSGVTAAVA